MALFILAVLIITVIIATNGGNPPTPGTRCFSGHCDRFAYPKAPNGGRTPGSLWLPQTVYH